MLPSRFFYFGKRRFILTLVLTALLLVLGNRGLKYPTQSQSIQHSFYVSPAGNDTNDGSLTHPWATVSHAAQVLKAGETLYVREGTYTLSEPIQAKHAGTARAWITYRAFPGERVILDAEAVPVDPPADQPPYAHDQGAFQLENVEYIKVQNLEIINSHNSGITVRNSHHIKLYNNTIQNTFSPGIGVWNSSQQKVIGNTVINANDLTMAGFQNDFWEAPHEAISLGSVENFEVAYNLVKDGQKEGIDIKEESAFGTVHHNYVHHMKRQGLYVDAWFGRLKDVELYNNVVYNCEGAGFALSVEGGAAAEQIRLHHNLLYDNWGSGIFFSRWGNDGLRQNIEIENNTIYRNGYGEPNPGEEYYWLTGGLYFFSDHLRDVQIKHNIFSDNTGFQIGYSDRYLTNSRSIEETLAQKNIAIDTNLVFGINSSTQPIYAGWADNYAHIYGINGDSAVLREPQFVDPEAGNFYLQPSFLNDATNGSTLPDGLLVDLGAFPSAEQPDLWWQQDFPPQFSD